MYILGLTTMGESAAALLRDGEIVACVEEERFSRKKHHIGFPYQSVRYCLREAGIGIDAVDHVAHYWKPWVLGHRIGHTLGVARVARPARQPDARALPAPVLHAAQGSPRVRHSAHIAHGPG